ncbi:MAG TPA: hypothetical protein VK629_05905 [Steroidobacteraceae bacterium]|nr:hypothetical protein [Steroidobacteraceae bacterium]
MGAPQNYVEADAYRIAREANSLQCELNAAVAVCVSDDTQGVGGLLHLRYIPHNVAKPVDLTDNTLSTDLLLLDRFCKDLRAEGARKQSWRVRLISHIPTTAGMDTPAATLFDLLRAYFADSRLAPECKELRRLGAVLVRLDPREGRVSVHAAEQAVPPAIAK